MLKLSEEVPCLGNTGNILHYDVSALGFWVYFGNPEGNAQCWISQEYEQVEDFVKMCYKVCGTKNGVQRIDVLSDLADKFQITFEAAGNQVKLLVVNDILDPPWEITISKSDLYGLANSIEEYYNEME